MNTPAKLLSADDEGVRVLTLNRPEKRNALDTALVEALIAALAAADADDAIGAIVITGAGTLFSAGADLGEFRAIGGDASAAHEQRSDLMLEMQLRCAQIGKPVIAAVNGSAIGAGVALALAADMVVMSADAKIGYPETKHGMVPSLMAGTLLRHAGRKAAFELLTIGDMIDAPRALALGLVNRVVAAAETMSVARQMAASLVALDRNAVSGTKRVVNACADLPLAEALRSGLALGRRLKSGQR